MGVTRETGVSSPTDLSILASSSPGVPPRATPTRSALRVETDTQESVVELLVPASSVVKLAICRRIAFSNSGFQQSRGPSEGYSYPVCTTCGRRHPGVLPLDKLPKVSKGKFSLMSLFSKTSL
nr:hypothetical protein [Tanacetum cinerariifolium]